MNSSYISSFDERQTMTSLDFEIFHYFGARPCNMKLHHHDFFEIYYIFGGSMDYIVEGNHFTLLPGDLLLISPLDLHCPDARSGQIFERIVLWFSMPYLTLLARDIPELLPTMLTQTATGRKLSLSAMERSYIEPLLFMLIDERFNHPHASREMCRMLLGTTLLRIQRLLMALPKREPLLSHIPWPAQQGAATLPLPTPMYEIFEYIDAHLEEKLSLSSLADHFFLDANTLSRKFKRQVGMTVCDYIRKKRLALTRVKISRGVSATQAGATSGFSDYSSFYRAFKNEYGISPREFAAKCK